VSAIDVATGLDSLTPLQTRGEGLQDFGAGWYALTAPGKKIDRD